MVQSIEPHYEFNAGSLALNFSNTVWERPGFLTDPALPHELLSDYEALSEWAEAAGILSSKGHRELSRAAARDPGKALRAYREALKLREAIFSATLGIILDRGGKESRLAGINQFIERLPPQHLRYDGDRIVPFETAEPEDLSCIQTAVCRDYQRLICSVDFSRLRVCAADDCGWLFLDTSKSGKRRWCTMSDCGNRDKVQRFLARRRGKG